MNNNEIIDEEYETNENGIIEHEYFNQESEV
jgi:hypothetical protein